MHSVLCKSVGSSKWFVFALELNILQTPKYTLSFIFEREKASFILAEERRKSGAAEQ